MVFPWPSQAEKNLNRFNTMFLQSFDKSFVLPILAMFIYKSPPESNRPKERKKTLDEFDRCVIKRTVHSMYNRKIAPTVSIIKKEIEDTKLSGE
jgi:hypothetical protein